MTMEDLAVSESEPATGKVSASIPAAPMICPVFVMPPEADALSAGVYQTLEDAGCPLAAETHKRLTFETLLTELSSRFVNVPAGQVDAQIEGGLQRIVELLGIDRSGLGEVSADGTQFVITHSYQLPGVPPSSRLMLHVDFPTCQNVATGTGDPHAAWVAAGSNAGARVCRRIGMKSHLAIPLTVMGHVVGGMARRCAASYFVGRTDPRPSRGASSPMLCMVVADEALRAKEQSLRRAREAPPVGRQTLAFPGGERRRIAREMHDDWTQRLAILGIDTAS
jgi:signal transduction histidine kinase